MFMLLLLLLLMTDFVVITETGFGPDDWQDRRHLKLKDWPGKDWPEKGEEDVLALLGDDDPDAVRLVLGGAARVSITFPATQDGRGFSLARRLREDGFTRRLRAVGPLMTDQYRHARQCGFDELAITRDHARRMPEQHWLDVINLPLPDYQQRLIRYGHPSA